MTRRAHRNRRIFVCVQGEDLAIRVAHAINVRLPGLRTLADTAESILARVERDDRAVVRDARFQLLPRTGTIAGHHKLVVTREHQLHGQLSLLRKPASKHSLDTDAKLRTKAA